MERYDVVFLPVAYSDLDEIFDYIMADNPLAASAILDTIMDYLKRLEVYPLSGAMLLDTSLKKFNFRMLVIKPYIIFNRFIDEKVFIYRVLHGARDYSQILQDSMQ